MTATALRSADSISAVLGCFFDGDDTLWETMPLYTEAKGRFYDLMAAAGFDRGAAEKRFEAVDCANVERFGFSQEPSESASLQVENPKPARHGRSVALSVQGPVLYRLVARLNSRLGPTWWAVTTSRNVGRAGRLAG